MWFIVRKEQNWVQLQCTPLCAAGIITAVTIERQLKHVSILDILQELSPECELKLFYEWIRAGFMCIWTYNLPMFSIKKN